MVTSFLFSKKKKEKSEKDVAFNEEKQSLTEENFENLKDSYFFRSMAEENDVDLSKAEEESLPLEETVCKEKQNSVEKNSSLGHGEQENFIKKEESDNSSNLVKPSRKKNIKKSSGAYKTISEVASEIGVATHVLRFWETKFEQIKPMKRGGRRYYDNENIEFIRSIKRLLHDDGYTIKGVQSYFANGGLKAEKKAAKETSLQKNKQTEERKMLLKELKEIGLLLDVS